MYACTNPALPLNKSATGWTSTYTQVPFIAAENCQGGGRIQISTPPTRSVAPGLHGQWTTQLPPGMSLTGMGVPAGAALINPNTQNAQGGGGFDVRYLWSGGSTAVPVAGSCCGGMDYAGATVQAISGRYFTIQVTCNKDSGSVNGDCIYGYSDASQIFDIKNITLTAADTVAPTVIAAPSAGGGTNLWSAGPWVRGPWELAFTASNPNASGVCATAAYLDGVSLPGGSSSAADNTQWQQCAASLGFADSIDTNALANGQHQLALDSIDAAAPANHSPQARVLGVDNQPPTVSLPASMDVPGNGSTAYVTATASSGASGTRDLTCSVDGGAAVSYPDPAALQSFTAEVPVAGLGTHHVNCTAQSNAVDSAGVLASSAPAASTVALREPTSVAATFGRIVDRERCRTVIRHGHHRRRCSPRRVSRRVTVIVKRHGHKVKLHRTVRVIVLPHVVRRSRLRIRYGHGATLSGVLGGGGGALAGVPVSVLAAPDNGSGAYAQVATAITSAAGTWRARIPAGPSRLLKALYAGSPSTEPAASSPVALSVPARIRIASIRPRNVPWGSTITIAGVLAGGYLPPGGALVELRYSYGRAHTVYGVRTHVSSRRFTTRFTFGPGQTPVVLGFQVGTLPQSDYAYAPALSNTVRVGVGGAHVGSSRHRTARRHRRGIRRMGRHRNGR